MADIEISTLGGVIKTAYEGEENTNAFTDAEKSKLAGIETEATKNASDATLLDRANHTGMQTAGTIIDLPDLLADKVSVVPGKGLSDTNFTQDEKDKLAQLEGAHFKGVHVGLTALQTAHPSAVAGDYAVVDDGVDILWYQWDAGTSEWSARVGESTEVTPAQVKSYYESNPDTNAYTDAEKAIVASLGGPGRFSLRRVGTWDAATNTPQLLDGTGTDGDYYVVTTPGTQYFGPGNRRFEQYDWVFFAGGVWNRFPAGDTPAVQWEDVQGKPSMYIPHGVISPPIPGIYAWSSNTIQVPSAVVTPYTCDASNFDEFNMLQDGSFVLPSWVTRFRVTASILFSSNGTGYRQVSLYRNGSLINTFRSVAVSGAYSTAFLMTPMRPVATANDVLEIRVYQNSGTTLDTLSGSWVQIELFEGA